MDDSYINDEAEALLRRNNVIFADDAVIEEIFHDNRRKTSFIKISYGVLGDLNMTHMELVTLVVDSNTIIRSRCGRRISVRDLRVGNVVDAEFSAAMTRSIPPQSSAYRITVVRENVNPNTGPNIPNIVEDRVMEVDTRNNFLYTGNPNDMMSQMRFVVNNMT
ncbi:MAG: hypothetical protein ACERLG_13495, partial [Sedimentibacter sp.]